MALAALGGLLFVLVLYFAYPQVKGMMGLVIGASFVLILTIVFAGCNLRLGKNDSSKSPGV